MVDYYKVLQVEHNCSQSDIKKAYKKLARKWHPDKNPKCQEEATKRFKELSEAYQVLSDDQKRRTYDHHGKGGNADRSNYGRESYTNSPRHETYTKSPRYETYTESPRYETYTSFDDDLYFPGRTRSRHGHRPHSRPQPDMNMNSSFVFREPEDVFREFFKGTDPFMDFFEPFGLGSQLRGRNEGALHRRKDASRPPSIFAHFEHPMMSFGGMSSFEINIPGFGPHGIGSSHASIFEDFDRMFANFDKLEGHEATRRSPSCDSYVRNPRRFNRSYKH